MTKQEKCNDNLLKRILEKSKLRNQMSCDLMKVPQRSKKYWFNNINQYNDFVNKGFI